MNEDRILIGGPNPQHLLLKYANRHGLIAGATGTGKTVTLQVLAEGFSAAGVPVFLADVKGDLAGMSQTGEPKSFLLDRAKTLGLGDLAFRANPVIFWDLFGRSGHPIRTTISEMGPLLLARLLQLNETQEGVLNIAFKLADDEGLPLLDLKDLRALLAFVAENAETLTGDYGNVSKPSVGAIQRQLLVLEQQGGEAFFGEPAFNLSDLMRTTQDSRGFVSILAADKLIESPRLYATFLLWLLSELFEELPEVGDLPKPRLVFFFDEAHLLFDDAPKALVDKVAQVVRLVRSKGVGVYFVTQNPLDVPEEVLGQLGNRVQHALRAFTPKDQKAVRSAAETFRPNPSFKTESVITELGVGEALVSTLDAKGTPTIVERTLIRPPLSRLGPVTDAERKETIAASPVGMVYDRMLDRDSAFEMLKARADKAASDAQAAEAEADKQKQWEAEQRRYEKSARTAAPAAPRGRTREGVGEAMAKSVARAIGSQVGRQIIRGVLGGLFKGR
jgi:DNA helicase HerA-like ATPase